ncbi:MAG TPA: amino acid ABC transporter permease [Acidimicrobiia bacterium]|nr:amino acid ABC transporter permease [Acidimicrobiia bacterium]
MSSSAPVIARATPVAWARKNLFNNWWSGMVTVVMLPILAYVAFRVFLFVFVNGRWEAVTRNLTLFMQGTFPREEQWRLIAQVLIFALAFGIGAGTNTASTKDAAEDAGLLYSRGTVAGTLRRMWSLVLFIAILLYFTILDPAGNLLNPFLLVMAVVAVGFIGYQVRLLPRRFRNVGWLLTAILLLFGFQVVSGFDAGGWWPLSLIFGIATYSALPTDRLGSKWVGVAAKLIAVVVVALVVRSVYGVVDTTGVAWDVWSGLHLTLMVSAIAIVLSFPLGLLLALARRSTLPALRWIATGYIEFIRGVPLISLLFMGQFVLGFLLPAGSDLSRVSRAIVAMSLFTAAYVAEIVRGGLQALPSGQTEAGQSLGLAATTIMRRIVLPQALRAVIPAMVGQFISLFKDSSLLTIIAILEFLGIREIIHAQADFRGVAIAETLVFVAFGYWAFAFAMSRESQRLERRLRVSR